ncbi:MAG: DUF1801 domain-containing protein [Chloroflexota bacterium]|nr:DUF1801 domain-containing protein [Chloroflexota bacterium]
MPARKVATKPAKSVDEYIASAPEKRRAALKKLRKTIKAAAPKANEIVSYGMAGFKQDGKRVAYFAYWKSHTALYGTSRQFIKANAAELKPYVQSKGTLQFPADKPLPYALVTKIVEGRVAEIEQGG